MPKRKPKTRRTTRKQNVPGPHKNKIQPGALGSGLAEGAARAIRKRRRRLMDL